MVYPTISTSLLAIFNFRCKMDPSKVKSINTALSTLIPSKSAVIMINALLCSEVAIIANQ
ncbi:MAG: hypothetical protein M3Y53_03725 [Thermoproteota archaeon]|nr:hypothetical protein [Thermoproteota archaeon]